MMRLTNMPRLATLFLSTSIFFSCGENQKASTSDSSLKIYNGTVPSDGGLIESSTVALVSSSQGVFCTGTLIDETHVVSAAHCLANVSGTVYVGFGRNSSEFTYVEASGWAINPNYDPNFRSGTPSDISILRLSEPAPAGYSPVDVYYGSLSSGDTLYLAGFGQTERGSSGQLYYRAVSVSNQSSDEITVSQGACYGDSGGPAYYYDGERLLVVGATSRASSAIQRCNGGAIYSSVPYFSNWLESAAGISL